MELSEYRDRIDNATNKRELRVIADDIGTDRLTHRYGEVHCSALDQLRIDALRKMESRRTPR